MNEDESILAIKKSLYNFQKTVEAIQQNIQWYNMQPVENLSFQGLLNNLVKEEPINIDALPTFMQKVLLEYYEYLLKQQDTAKNAFKKEQMYRHIYSHVIGTFKVILIVVALHYLAYIIAKVYVRPTNI